MRKMILRAGRIARLHPIVQVSRSVVDSVSVEARRNRVESVSVEDRRSRVESVSVEDRRSRAASVAASVPVLCHRSLRHLIATRTG